MKNTPENLSDEFVENQKTADQVALRINTDGLSEKEASKCRRRDDAPKKDPEPAKKPPHFIKRKSLKVVPKAPTLHLSPSQKQVFEVLHERATLYWSQDFTAPGIPLQTNSLILGPTGVGKSSVVAALAKALNAQYYEATFGSWVPIGAADKTGEATLVAVVRHCCWYARVVVFVDELDKFFTVQASQSWDRSIADDIWAIFDRRLNWASLCKIPEISNLFEGGEISPEELAYYVKTRLFLVAAGTWQDAFRERRSTGFGGEVTSAAKDGKTLAAAVVKQGLLPAEVRRRFHWEPLMLHYPSVQELAALFEADKNLMKMLSEMGITLEYKSISERLPEYGLSVLPSIKADTALRYEKWKREHTGTDKVASLTLHC